MGARVLRRPDGRRAELRQCGRRGEQADRLRGHRAPEPGGQQAVLHRGVDAHRVDAHVGRTAEKRPHLLGRRTRGGVHRPGAELLAWSAVHGMAMLALEGPLRDLPPGAVDELAPRLVRMVDLGLGLSDGAD